MLKQGLKRMLVLGMMASFIAVPLTAGSQNVGADFLKIGVGARAVSMGSAFVAAANDISAVYWNPAGLAHLDENQFSAMHAEWLSDMSFDFLGAAMPTQNGTIGLSAIYLCQDDIDRRDSSGADTGKFGAYDAALSVSYARNVS